MPDLRDREIDCDILIVGYGPVGQTMAALLASSGHEVAVVERYPDRYRLPRAGHFDGETMRTFQALGLADELELITRLMTRYEMVTPEWEVLERIPLGEGDQGWHPSYLFHQPELEDLLDRCAVESGANIITGYDVVSLEQDDEGVTVRAVPFERAGGSAGSGSATADSATAAGDLVVRAKYVLGADGARSTVRGLCGIDRHDLGFAPIENLVVDFEHANPDREIPLMGDVRQVLDPKRPNLSGRWNGNSWSRWEFRMMPGETPDDLQTEAKAWELLEPWGIRPGDGEIIRRAVYVFEGTLADSWRSGRVLLIGDAAHTTPPFMGQGMCSGIRDAANLGWKLDAVLAGTAGQGLLDSYETERRTHVKQLIEMAMEIGQEVLITDPQEAAERDRRLRDRRDGGATPPRRGFPTITGGLIRRDERTDLPGRLLPQGRVARGRERGRLDDLVGHGWRIVSRHPVDVDALSERNRALLERLGVELVHVTRGLVGDCGSGALLDIDAVYSKWFLDTGRKVVVERPDHIIFGTAADNEGLPELLDALEAALAELG